MAQIPTELAGQAQRKRELALFVRGLAATASSESARARILLRAEVLEREAKEIEEWAKPE
jgi:hypothetical protein